MIIQKKSQIEPTLFQKNTSLPQLDPILKWPDRMLLKAEAYIS